MEGSVDSPLTPGGAGAVGASLTREKDLVANIHDLDKLFDTSDEEGSDHDAVSAVVSHTLSLHFYVKWLNSGAWWSEKQSKWNWNILTVYS